jgi:cell division septation protein DedD
MAPLLIDSRDLFKLVLFSVVAVSAVFAGGVFVGHQRAATFYQAGVTTQPLSLPERTVIADSSLESLQPEEVVAGEYIDVDFPEPALTSSTKDTRVQVMASASSFALVDVPGKGKVVPETQNTHYESTAGSDSKRIIPLNTESKDNRENSVEVSSKTIMDNHALVSSTTTDDLAEIKYSIQAGVYGRLHNAENMMKQLRSDKYEAYITDYTNKNNETRYNVRFGYFVNKKAALASLEKFKSDKSGDGYLVKFSASNIVNLADATSTVESGAASIQVDGDKNSSTSTVTPAVTMSDKISQVDISTDKSIQTN